MLTNSDQFSPLVDFYRYWGKAGNGKDWHPLAYHSLDVAAVGTALLREQTQLRKLFTDTLGINTDVLLEWIGFWLTLHDLGKFAVSFQNQRPDLLQCLQQRSVAVAYTVRHDSLGAKVWQKLLQRHDVLGLGPNSSRYAKRLQPWVYAVTGHHGQPPVSVASLTEHMELQDEEAAASFANAARALLLPDTTRDAMLGLDARTLGDPRLSWWLAGIAVLADWIGSNTDYFEYHPNKESLENYWAGSKRKALKALVTCGMLPIRHTTPKPVVELFGWDKGDERRHPTPLQQWAQDIELPQEPQLFLLEDVTGAGKTEAALELAHRLICADLADGLFFGLPTMATANAMYNRVAQAANPMFAEQTPPSVVLAHGQRRLHHGFRNTVLPATPVEGTVWKTADESASARCAAWLADNNKKALLANVGVGTIDQAMLAILHARHQSLRLLGLFRKVLIVDEVHACDAYMLRLLETLLRFHAAAGGSAILLTATLPQRMKTALAAAYCSGRGRRPPATRKQDYPLATHIVAGQCLEQPLQTRPEVCRNVALDYVDTEADIHARINAALERGQCVCWIRNTVADAVLAWEQLAPTRPAHTVSLFHARFAMGDRLDIEARIERNFGPNSTAAQRRSQLVIATQVVEQSLDVDFDILITDLAPIDRLIQRAGRLRRHTRDIQGNRVNGVDERGTATLVVFGPTWAAQPAADWYKKMYPRAAYVYPHVGQLWLTARWLAEHGKYAMPGDARNMIESVFGEAAEDAIPDALRAASADSEGKDWAATNLAATNTLQLETGYISGGYADWARDNESVPCSALDTWGGQAGSTRLGDPSVTVRLARSEGGRLTPWCRAASPAEAWEASSLRMAARFFPPPNPNADHDPATAQTLETMPDRGRWSTLLCLARVGDQWRAETMSESGNHYAFTYDTETGLRHESTSPQTP